MSAIVSLLKVMTLRDAEQMVLEAGKIPSLRRKGHVEALAMPALEAKLIGDFATPLLGGKTLDDGPLMVTFTEDGSVFPVTIEKVTAGLRLVIRKPSKAPAKTRVVTPPVPLPVVNPPPAARTSSMVIEAASRTQDFDPADMLYRRIAHMLATPIAIARERGASDVLLSTGQTPRMRLDGQLEPLDTAVDEAELVACVSALVKGEAGADFSLELDGGRLRVNAFDHLGGHAIAARLIRDRVPTLGELELPPELATIVDHRDGLVLVCGPTGSGKSTTLATLVDLIGHRRAAHVITLEDPIEYRFVSHRGLVHQRELGTHIPTFAAGLRAALREAPDVILLGEMRDPETIAAALTAAETGHLVLATLHAASAVGAIDRIVDAFPDQQQRQIRHQLAACLRTVVTQFLLPRRDGGRAPAIEYVPVNSAVANIIRKGDLHTLPTAIQSGRDAGMIPLERSLAKLIDSGAVAPQVVKRIAADHDLLSSLAGKLR